MSKEVENARKELENDLKNAPHVLANPLGSSVTSDKIHRYLFNCVVSNEEKANSVDWLYSLYKEQTDEEHDKFQQSIDAMAIALYKFYEYLNKTK